MQARSLDNKFAAKAKTIDDTKRVMKAKALADRKIDTLLDDICDMLSYVKQG